jgi:hypothetical protein
VFPSNMVCLKYVSVNTLHNNNHNNRHTLSDQQRRTERVTILTTTTTTITMRFHVLVTTMKSYYERLGYTTRPYAVVHVVSRKPTVAWVDGYSQRQTRKLDQRPRTSTRLSRGCHEIAPVLQSTFVCHLWAGTHSHRAGMATVMFIHAT